MDQPNERFGAKCILEGLKVGATVSFKSHFDSITETLWKCSLDRPGEW